MRRSHIIAATLGIAAGAVILTILDSRAQREVVLLEPEEAQEQLRRATREGQRASARAERLAREADEATQAAEKTASEAAAVAALIQAAEADIAAARARYSLAQAERAALSDHLAKRQQPLVRLTGALQTSARRPLALWALQPGSLKDLVYVRAVLDTAVPEIRTRTAALRGELDQRRRLERQAERALAALQSGEEELQRKRTELARIETRQRLASREARNNAARESERALGLAEEARDLASQQEPGPTPRPSSTRPPGFQLPVQGRTIRGFGELLDSGLRSTSLALAPARGAQVIAPASGRGAFAGPYRGFGRIVIIEHEGGWTSLVTGLGGISAEVGDQLIAGSPLGVAGGDEPTVTLELRRDGEPVNPLNFLG